MTKKRGIGLGKDFGSRRASQNVEYNPINWPAFMAEQMRNIPPIIGSGPTGTGAVPPPLGGRLGPLGNIDRVLREAAMRGGLRYPYARYILSNPDEPPFDPTYQWDLQHR